MKFVVVIVATALSAGAASAQGLESMQIANELGTVIASEEVCGLSYDQAAIEAFIAKKVSADDMSFASTLNMMVMGTEAQIGDMSASAKTAHCAQIKRVAKSYGFTK
ncbi:MAG: signal recognition particle [Rhizobiaceae bacterium]|nr:signal recognition particle [Rhizobiaceae bacterium]